MSEKQIFSEAKLLTELDKNIPWEIVSKVYNENMNELNVDLDFCLKLKLKFTGIRAVARRALYISEYLKLKNKKNNCSRLFSITLKLASISNNIKQITGYSLGTGINSMAANFYFNIDKCSDKEMLLMKEAIINRNKYSLPIEECAKYEFDAYIDYYKLLSKAIPVKMFFINLIFGDTIKISTDLRNYAVNKDFVKYEELLSKHESHMFIAMVAPSIKMIYEKGNDSMSRLAIFQAELESRLNAPITAIDPEDGKPIRFVENNGKKKFYCLGAFNSDEKGKGKNITTVLSEIDFKEQQERIEKLKKVK